MAVSMETVIEARKGKPIQDCIIEHQHQFSSLSDMVNDWKCDDITVRRILKRNGFKFRGVPVRDGGQP